MAEKIEGSFKCQSCGGKAELFIDDDSPEGEGKAGKLVCTACGAVETVSLGDAQDERLKAVLVAVDAGVGELRPEKRIESTAGSYDTRDNDIQALKTAISKESEAADFYRQMVEKTNDPDGKKMFETLVKEEEMHRQLLNDQYYSLQNRGEWVWGD
jgi:hypothetical protein